MELHTVATKVKLVQVIFMWSLSLSEVAKIKIGTWRCGNATSARAHHGRLIYALSWIIGIYPRPLIDIRLRLRCPRHEQGYQNEDSEFPLYHVRCFQEIKY